MDSFGSNAQICYSRFQMTAHRNNRICSLQSGGDARPAPRVIRNHQHVRSTNDDGTRHAQLFRGPDGCLSIGVSPVADNGIRTRSLQRFEKTPPDRHPVTPGIRRSQHSGGIVVTGIKYLHSAIDMHTRFYLASPLAQFGKPRNRGNHLHTMSLTQCIHRVLIEYRLCRIQGIGIIIRYKENSQQ